jgi:hypothetical protein
MKNNAQHLYWSSVILVLLVGSIGCGKTGASFNTSAISYISIMNMAPYSSTVDIYFNGTLVSPSGGIAPGLYSKQYGQFKPGNYTVDFKKTGTDSLLYELPALQYDTSAFYTIVLYNISSGSPAVQAAVIQDNFSQVNNNTMAYWRFLDMSPDASNVSLSMNGTVVQSGRTPADNFSSQVFNQFQQISSGNYTLQVQNSVTDSVLATQSNYAFGQGDVYTIFLTGTAKAGMTVNVLPVIF